MARVTGPTMTVYWFADERVECDIELPLVATTGPPDVTVVVHLTPTLESPRFTRLLHRGDLDGAPWALGPLPGGGWGAVLGTGCVATISADARRIELSALPSAPVDWLAEATVSWALVYRLGVLGRPAFHASAATIDGERAVAFCGATLSGKSTMAAASLTLGGSLLTDDVLVPRLTADNVFVSSTTSAVKLRGAAQSLSDDPPSERAASMTFDDRLRVTSRPAATSLPLSHIVFLDPIGDREMRPLSPHAVAVRLLAESKIGAWLWDEARFREFDVACDIANLVPGFIVGRSHADPTREELVALCARLYSA